MHAPPVLSGTVCNAPSSLLPGGMMRPVEQVLGGRSYSSNAVQQLSVSQGLKEQRIEVSDELVALLWGADEVAPSQTGADS